MREQIAKQKLLGGKKIINQPVKRVQSKGFWRKQIIMNLHKGYLINANVKNEASQKWKVLDAPEKEPKGLLPEKSMEQAQVKVELKSSNFSNVKSVEEGDISILQHGQAISMMANERSESIAEKQHRGNLDNAPLVSIIPVNQIKCNTWQVETWVNYLAVTAQFDTRSTYSYIRQDVVNELAIKNGSIKVRPCTNISVFSTKGEWISVIGTVSLNLMICGRKCPVELRVVHALPTFLVLGMDFLRSNWIIADFGQQSWGFMDNLTLTFPFSSCNLVDISLPTKESEFKDKWTPSTSIIDNSHTDTNNNQTHRDDRNERKHYYSRVRDHKIKRRDRPWKMCRKCGVMFKKTSHRCLREEK